MTPSISPDAALIYEVREGIATITLNRPEAYNALDLALARDLFHAALEAGEDPAVRCVVVTGAGRAFCAGGDLKSFARSLDTVGPLIRELTTYLHGAISRLARAPKPVLMAVQGTAAGGGMSLALCGDLLLASESATFDLAYARIGASPDGASTWFLPRAIGVSRALELYLTARVLAAREAMAWGLVHRVVPDADFARVVGETARRLADGPTFAIGEAKRLFQASMHNGLETQMELEATALAACASTSRFRESVTAFAHRGGGA